MFRSSDSETDSKKTISSSSSSKKETSESKQTSPEQTKNDHKKEKEPLQRRNIEYKIRQPKRKAQKRRSVSPPILKQPKKKTIPKKCKFWPKCKNPKCRYVHPTEQCKKFPACWFGDDCLYIHPSIKCKYGHYCTREGCSYEHPHLMSTLGPPKGKYYLKRRKPDLRQIGQRLGKPRTFRKPFKNYQTTIKIVDINKITNLPKNLYKNKTKKNQMEIQSKSQKDEGINKETSQKAIEKFSTPTTTHTEGSLQKSSLDQLPGEKNPEIQEK